MPKTINTSIEEVLLGALKIHPRNANQGDFGAIQQSVEANGFYGTVVANKRTGYILAGNHRFAVAKSLGFERVPVAWVDVDDEEELRILIADNRTTRLGIDNEAQLAELLSELAATPAGLLGTGFDGDDLDRMIADLAGGSADAERELLTDPDEVPESAPTRCNAGDLWQLGRHRLICGDSTDAATVERLMGGALINVAVTSPPYAEQREYDASSGFVPIKPSEYVAWFAPIAANVARHLSSDGSWFVNIKPSVDDLDTQTYVLDLVLAHVRDWGWHFATEFCWERNGVPKHPGLRFKNQFEPVYQFARNRWKFRPDNVRHESQNVPKSRGKGAGNTNWKDRQGDHGVIPHHDRPRKNGTTGTMADTQGVSAAPGDLIGPGLAYPGNRLPTFTSTHEALGHAAAFPVGLPKFFIDAYTDPRDNVYEPFGGSGSTLIAAEQSNRVCFCVELSPAYCDIILKRWEDATGETATLLEAGDGR
jgi:DNA modification methylase